MIRDTELDLKVTPDEIKRALRACIERIGELDGEREGLLLRAHTYNQMLRIKGLTPDEIEQITLSVTGAGSMRTSSTESPRRFRGKKIAVAAAIAISESPSGKMHGHQVLEALERGGLKVKGKAPKATIFSTLKRSKLFAPVEGEPNTWRLIRPAPVGRISA